MSKFKVGDVVKVVDDLTPEGSGQHLIGMIGEVTEISTVSWAGQDYRYRVTTNDDRRILANAPELELYRPELLNDGHEDKLKLEFVAGGPLKFKEPEKGVKPVIPIGRTVEVDVDMPHSQWYKARGVIMAPPYSDGKYKVRLIADGPNKRLGDMIGSTCLLTGLTPLVPSHPRVLPDGKTTIMFDPSAGAKKGVSHYAAGMPEGIEPMDIIRTQGWAKHFAYGNALKYLCRAPHKGTELVDVNKAIDYLKEVANIIEQESK